MKTDSPKTKQLWKRTIRLAHTVNDSKRKLGKWRKTLRQAVKSREKDSI